MTPNRKLIILGLLLFFAGVVIAGVMFLDALNELEATSPLGDPGKRSVSAGHVIVPIMVALAGLILALSAGIRQRREAKPE